MMAIHKTEIFIKARLSQAGFNQVVIIKPKLPVGFELVYNQSMRQGRYGQMGFLLAQAEFKTDPSRQGKYKSLILASAAYYRPKIKLTDIDVSLYSQSQDYHKVLMAKLRPVVKELKQAYPGHDWLASADW